MILHPIHMSHQSDNFSHRKCQDKGMISYATYCTSNCNWPKGHRAPPLLKEEVNRFYLWVKSNRGSGLSMSLFASSVDSSMCLGGSPSEHQQLETADITHVITECLRTHTFVEFTGEELIHRKFPSSKYPSFQEEKKIAPSKRGAI